MKDEEWEKVEQENIAHFKKEHQRKKERSFTAEPEIDWEKYGIVPEFPFDENLHHCINQNLAFESLEIEKSLEIEFEEWSSTIFGFSKDFRHKVILRAIDLLTELSNRETNKNRFIKQLFEKYIGLVIELEATSNESKPTFKTTLTDTERLELCNKIIADKGGKIIKSIDERLFIGIEEKHKQTLIYLLGGSHPTTSIKKIKIKSQDVVYDLLFRISVHKNKNNETYIPTFVLKIICPETLEINKTLKSNHSKSYDFLNKYLPKK